MYLKARDFSGVVVADLLRLLSGRYGDKLSTCTSLPTRDDTDIRVWSLHLCKRKKKNWTRFFPDTKGHQKKGSFIQKVHLQDGKSMNVHVFLHSVIPSATDSQVLDRIVYISSQAECTSEIDVCSPCVIHYVPAEPRPHQQTKIPSCAKLAQEILRPCNAYRIVTNIGEIEKQWSNPDGVHSDISCQADLMEVLGSLPEGSDNHFVSMSRPKRSLKVVSVQAQSTEGANLGTMEKLEYSSSEDGDYARKYLTPIYQEGTKLYMSNANTDFGLCMVKHEGSDGEEDCKVICTFPYSINRVGGPMSRLDTNNSYVCSPVNHYLTYGIYLEELGGTFYRVLTSNAAIEEETRKVPWVLRKIALFLFLPFFIFFQLFMVDKVVYVNNWLLSTNLYPNVAPDGPAIMGAIVDHMKEKYPDHAIVFRSVDGFWNGHIKHALESLGCMMAFSRKIFYQNMVGSYVKQSPSFQRDLAVIKSSPYRKERILSSQDVSPEELLRILDLYYKLYVEKYTSFNPLFSLEFLKHMLDNNLLNFILLRHKETNSIDGVLGYFKRNGCITTPFVGYDTSLDQNLGLYRMLVTLVSLEGRDQGCMINCSAGVGKFKASRAGIGVLEYNAVYLEHLPRWRHWPWRYIRWFGASVVVPLIDKYNL